MCIRDSIETIFVLNDKKQLIGTADLRDILVSDEKTTLKEIMDDQVISVYPETCLLYTSRCV